MRRSWAGEGRPSRLTADGRRVPVRGASPNVAGLAARGLLAGRPWHMLRRRGVALGRAGRRGDPLTSAAAMSGEQLGRRGGWVEGCGRLRVADGGMG